LAESTIPQSACGAVPVLHAIPLAASWHGLQESPMNSTLPTRQLAGSISRLFALGLATAGTPYAQQTIGTCSVLPANNIWNTPVDTLPVLPNSASMVTTIGGNRRFHADFGAGTWNGGPIGIPFI
jgi:hypothetical protein